MKTRVIKGHIQYIQGVLQGKHDLKRIVKVRLERKKSKWARMTSKYLETMWVEDT